MLKRFFTRQKRVIITSSWYKTIIRGSKKIVLPGFEGISLFYVAGFFFKGLQEGYLSVRAAAMSFRFFMALFPALIFLFTLIPYVPYEGFQSYLMSMIDRVLPHSIAKIANPTITDLITKKRGGLLSFGFVMTIYYSINGIAAMISAFNLSHNIKERSNYFKSLWYAVIILFVLSILVIVAIGLIVFGGVIMEFLKDNHIVTGWVNLIFLNLSKWIIVLLFYIFSISLIYYLGSGRKVKFRFISAGSTLSSITSIIISLGFAYYVNNFGGYNKLYGSIGVIIVLMMWMYLNSLVLLLGFELNASISSAKSKNKSAEEVILEDEKFGALQQEKKEM